MQGKPSKSAMKRRQHALQALGEALIELPEESLRQIPLEDVLFEAIRAASQMKARGALRRQRQLIGKMMRDVDPEPIRAALDAATRTGRRAKSLFRKAEYWRDQIVACGRPAVDRFAADTGTTIPVLEQLVDSLHRCRTEDERRRVERQIFRAIHGELGAKMHNTAS